MADALERFYVVPETEATEELEPLMIGRPKDYVDTVFTLGAWEDDYRSLYDDEPFAGMDVEAFWAAARRATFLPPIELTDEPGPDE